MKNNTTFKPFAVGDRVVSEADGPGTVCELSGMLYPINVLFDSGHTEDFTYYGHMYLTLTFTKQNIRHMTAEEQSQFPKPE